MNRRNANTPEHPDEFRMTIGEHLDELRGCLVRSLIALLIGCLICIYPAKWLFALVARPVLIALHRHNQVESFLQTSPTEVFLIYVKVVVIVGLILASPYVLHQIWSFVATGLYKHERRWVQRLIWPSVGLFLTGVAFMYVLVLPLSLDFLIRFSDFLPLPDVTETTMEKMLLGSADKPLPASQPASQPTSIPTLAADPEKPPHGSLWFNAPQGRLKLRMGDETLSLRMTPDEHRSMVTTHFQIGEYLSFVLVMTLAFGLAFQLPLVVVFLARSGIVPVPAMRKYRRMVILLIVIVAAMLAPPDLLSHALLSVPMILLFEIGLLIAARNTGKSEQPADETS